ncbi:MAG: BatD family protein [Leptospiraceae bacterium]|nr:BatD family protein [Leptospiraceae bacterium]MCP5502332.1 BatD family protein [Leptospiraceae bacterium]
MKKVFLVYLVILVFPLSLLAEVQFRLSKDTVLKGEPLYAIFEINGNPDVVVPRNIFSKDSVTAEYIGIEQSFSSINFQVKRKKIVKFRVVTSKHGTLSLPEIQINVDGKTYSSGNVSFTVKNKRYKVQKPTSIFDRIFNGRDPFRNYNYIEPAEDDIRIQFALNKEKVYVGETVVGYYKILYTNMSKPYFERNQMKNMEFPFFTSELLDGVSISLSETETVNNRIYDLIPYNKEIYALTPLKEGTFVLGNTHFDVEGNPDTYFTARVMEAKGIKVKVKGLPNPQPVDFSGEVGKYELKVNLEANTIGLGQNLELRLKVFGEGAGLLIRDPLSSLCKNGACADFDITYIRETRDRKFTKLQNGSHGFYSNTEFFYSLRPRKEGNLLPGNVKIVFFNPSSEKYETASAEIPAIYVSKSSFDSKESGIYRPKKEPFHWFPYFLGFSLVLGFGFSIFFFRVRIVKHGINILALFNLKILPLEPESLMELDRVIGMKKGALLKNSLLEKGFQKQKVYELLQLKRNCNNQSLLELYQKSDNLQKEYLLKFATDFFKEG